MGKPRTKRHAEMMTAFDCAIEKYRSQKAAAEAWGLSQGYVSDMANGRRGVSVNAAVAIETATGISARDLLYEQTKAELEKARKRVASERQNDVDK